jgi:hypothetical protein
MVNSGLVKFQQYLLPLCLTRLTLGNPLFLSQYIWEVSLHIFSANFLHYGLNGGHGMPYILDKVRKLNETGPFLIRFVETMLLEVRIPQSRLQWP